MPAAIALVATFAATLGTGAIGATAIYYGVSAALYLGIGIGLQFLSQMLFKPSSPRPEDVQTSLKQPAQPRQRHYGRVKVSGPWLFAESKAGIFYKVLALGEGPIDAFEEFWFDDKKCILDADGWMTNHWYGQSVKIKSRLGAVPETAYGELTSQFPEWTNAHRGDGVASLLAMQFPVEQENFLTVFPNGANTAYRAVLRGAKVLNPVSGVTAWSDNAAAVMLDYMKHIDGMRLPAAIFNKPLALAGWQAAFNRATENVPLKGGGTEDRYRLWGSYFLNERPADVLGRMLACCDGRLWPTPDGGLALDIGQWAEPTVIIDENAIVGFSDFSRGKDILTTANTIRATYLDPTQDYQTADADPWIDTIDVGERGEIEMETSFIMSPSHSQTRRLMKLAAWRANPLWVGTFQLNLAGLAAVGERLVRITFPPFEIDEVFEVQNLQLIVGENNILQGVMIQVQSMPQTAYQWDADEEQGEGPVSTGSTVDHTIPVPTGFDAVQIMKNVGGQTYPFARLSWDALPASLRAEAHGRKVGDTTWQNIAVAVGETSADSFLLEDGATYEFQIRAIAGTGRRGAWTPSETVAVREPLALAAFSLTGSAPRLGNAAFSFTTNNDANLHHIALYRVVSGGVLNRATDHVTDISVTTVAATYAYVDGDNTRTNILLNSTFAADTNWTKGTGWTIAGGVATHAAGTTANLSQAGSAYAAGTYRYGAVVSGRTAGVLTPFINAPAVTGPAISANGQFLGSLSASGAQTSFGFTAGSTFVGSVDDAYFFAQSATCAPQGSWDYYAEPVNPYGTHGPLAGPLAVTII